MTPYWKRRVDGEVFGEWLGFVFSVVVVALNLLRLSRPRPLDGWDYFQMAAWTFAMLMYGRLVWTRRRRRGAGEGGHPGAGP